MQDISLYLLKVFADRPAVLVIDGVPAVKTGPLGAALPVSGGELLVQLFSLEDSAPPISRYICLKEPSMCGTGDNCELCMLSDGVFELTACFEKSLNARSMPFVISQINIPFERHTKRATVYYDSGYALAVEQAERAVLTSQFSGEVDSAELFVQRFSGARYLFAKAAKKECAEFRMVRIEEKDEVMISREISSFELNEARLTLVSRIYGAQIKEVFISASSAPADVMPVGGTEADIMSAFVYAVMCRNESAAKRMMSQSLLNDVSFSDMTDYIGEPYKVRVRDRGVMLMYKHTDGVSRGRILKASLKNEKIANIEEV